MLKDGFLYFDESYSSLVDIKDGKPVTYMSLAGPPSTPADAEELVEKVRAKTGFTVRFGEWVQDPPGDPRDRGWTVRLTIVD